MPVSHYDLPTVERHVAGAVLFRHNIAALVRRFAEMLPNGAVVLDAGAGDAPYRSLFNHCDYTTTDWGESPHDGARRADIVADLRELPVPSNSIDAVVLTEVLEHVSRPSEVVEELSRILRPGGRILITVPFVIYLHEEPHDYARYTPYALAELARDAGITPIEVSPLGGVFSVLGIALQHIIGGAMHRGPKGRISGPILGLFCHGLMAVADRLAPRLDKLDPSSTFPPGWALLGVKD